MKRKIAVLIPCVALLVLGCGKGSGGGGGTNQPPANDPQITIDDVTKFEGNAGTTPFQFNVSLDHASNKQVTVSYSTSDGTAKAGQDYQAATGQQLTFQPGETTKSIVIDVLADSIEEADDVFSVTLSNPVNAGLAKASATGTIRNDDTKAAFSDTGYDAPTSYPGYTLAWSDEFNGPTLDPAAWTFETGNNNGWGNKELENYTDGGSNVSFQNGKLVIHALNNTGSGYTSARIKTQGKKEFQYGRVDIRAILPKGQGIWPALWMLGSNINTVGWPACGEIDIMELLGQDPAKVYGTLHYGTSANPSQKGASYVLANGNFNDQFHVFSMEWQQDQIKLFVDNNLYLTVNKSDINPPYDYPFNAPFFFIFNVAVGGQWPGNPDASTYFPQWMIVDYIRVYK